ncbi:hypothetical protein BJX65DRAFT_300736 [Aspergillus insuetus]
MEVVQKNEAFKRINGRMKFSYAQVLQDGILYTGTWTNRSDSLKTLEDLQEKPSLLAYINGILKSKSLAKLKTCEILHKNPYSNITTYYGYNKTHSQVSGFARDLVREDIISSLTGILAAIKHLHLLGLVHNNINPTNITLDNNGTLVLIDFNNYCYIRKHLRNTKIKRTHHWHGPYVEIWLKENDFDAFK